MMKVAVNLNPQHSVFKKMLKQLQDLDNVHFLIQLDEIQQEKIRPRSHSHTVKSINNLTMK